MPDLNFREELVVRIKRVDRYVRSGHPAPTQEDLAALLALLAATLETLRGIVPDWDADGDEVLEEIKQTLEHVGKQKGGRHGDGS